MNPIQAVAQTATTDTGAQVPLSATGLSATGLSHDVKLPSLTTSWPSAFLASTIRSVILKRLAKVEWGSLTVKDIQSGETHHFGDPDANVGAVITVRHPRAWVMMGTAGDIGAGEAFAEGLWQADSLTDFLRICSHPRNAKSFEGVSGLFGKLFKPALNRIHHARSNSVSQARRNISAHYDLGNDFFSQWLDSRMMYSSAVWTQPEHSLEEAQLEKIDRICRKLDLQPGQTLLEIGTGWGGFAIHAAAHYDVDVVTTTISAEQARYAREKVAEAGLEGQVKVIETDYRDLSGSYDAIVSIEMIEAVGHQYLDGYIAQLGKLLKPHGMALLQAITMEDHRYESYKRSNNFINHYIFPGGCLPSLTSIHQSMAGNSDLRLLHLEDFGTDYARTLSIWHQRLLKNRDKLPLSNQDPWFFRLWQFYLCACEALFLERRIGLAQLVLAKPEARPLPLLAP